MSMYLSLTSAFKSHMFCVAFSYYNYIPSFKMFPFTLFDFGHVCKMGLEDLLNIKNFS